MWLSFPPFHLAFINRGSSSSQAGLVSGGKQGRGLIPARGASVNPWIPGSSWSWGRKEVRGWCQPHHLLELWHVKENMGTNNISPTSSITYFSHFSFIHIFWPLRENYKRYILKTTRPRNEYFLYYFNVLFCFCYLSVKAWTQDCNDKTGFSNVAYEKYDIGKEGYILFV